MRAALGRRMAPALMVALIAAVYLVAFMTLALLRDPDQRANMAVAPTTAPTTAAVATNSGVVAGAEASSTVPAATAMAPPNPTTSAPTPVATGGAASIAASATSPVATTTALPSPTIPSPAPTVSPPSPTVAPTAPVPTPTTPFPSPIAVTTGPSPTAVPPPLAPFLRSQVAAAEAGLRTGQFIVTTDSGDGTRVVEAFRFDLGDGQYPPRLHVLATYEDSGAIRITEQLTIGERSWQRAGDGPWLPAETQQDVPTQVYMILPQVELATNPSSSVDGTVVLLRWRNAFDNADVTLEIDPNNGVPRQMERTDRTSGARRSVRYERWNEPVDIMPAPTP